MNEDHDFKDDELLQRLVQTAQEIEAEDARFDERWDRLAEGELGDAEAAELAEESAAAHELFQPLGSGFHDGVVKALRAQPGGGAAVSAEGTGEEKGKVLPFRRRAPYLGGLLAAAAALFLLILGRPSEPVPLPEYRAELLGGARDVRSGAESPSREVPLYRPGNQLEIVLRPEAAVEGEVAVRCFLDRDGDVRRWDVPAEISDRGSVRITGTIGRDLPIEPGRVTLHLAIGRPDTLPDEAALQDHLATPSSRPWKLLSTSFEVGELEDGENVLR
jgi:hypothetical protein